MYIAGDMAYGAEYSLTRHVLMDGNYKVSGYVPCVLVIA